MREITVRQLLRNFKSIFPIPQDGICVRRRGGDLYLYGRPRPSQVMIEDLVRQVKKLALRRTCEWQKLVSSSAPCVEDDTDLVRVESKSMNDKLYLCPRHVGVLEQTGVAVKRI